MQETGEFGRLLMFLGVGLVLIGATLVWLPKLSWFGHLPGDIMIQRRHMTIVFPLTTCFVLSLAASLLVWLVGRWLR